MMFDRLNRSLLAVGVSSPSAVYRRNPLLPTLLFMHGWAFDASVWNKLRTELAAWPQVVADAGYFGHPVPAYCEGPVVAIGHSLGALHLIHTPPPLCKGMVFINGFSRFTAASDFPHGVAGRLVDRMRQRLRTNATAVVNDFLLRCGATATATAPHPDRLLRGLDTLQASDTRAALQALQQPLLVLAGNRDPIVSPAMSEDAFVGRPIVWCNHGGHLLPLTDPAWCGAHIRAFLASLAPADARSV